MIKHGNGGQESWYTQDTKQKIKHIVRFAKTGSRFEPDTGELPDDIPAGPDIAYKKEWITFGDWLGSGVIAYKYKTWKTFEDAKHFAILLKLQSFEEWKDNGG